MNVMLYVRVPDTLESHIPEQDGTSPAEWEIIVSNYS